MVEAVRRWRKWFGSAAVFFLSVAMAASGLSLTLSPHDTETNVANYALMVSAGALGVSLLGFLSTTVMAWRADRRAMRAEARAQEEHSWKKAERETSGGFGL
jgi:hypothetical protein